MAGQGMWWAEVEECREYRRLRAVGSWCVVVVLVRMENTEYTGLFGCIESMHLCNFQFRGERIFKEAASGIN